MDKIRNDSDCGALVFDLYYENIKDELREEVFLDIMNYLEKEGKYKE